MRLVVNGDMIYNFMHAKREVWEKSVARERVRSRFQKKFIFLKKVQDFEENTWISYSKQCFRGLGVLYEYIIHGL